MTNGKLLFVNSTYGLCAKIRVPMRRRVSITVLLVILTALLAPLTLAGVSSMPACCRVGGQHHCMATPGLDGFHSLPSCPYRVAPAVTSATATLIRVRPVSQFETETKSALPPSIDRLRIAVGDIQKRGPPIA
jgi:hypothetical protein